MIYNVIYCHVHFLIKWTSPPPTTNQNKMYIPMIQTFNLKKKCPHMLTGKTPQPIVYSYKKLEIFSKFQL